MLRGFPPPAFLCSERGLHSIGGRSRDLPKEVQRLGPSSSSPAGHSKEVCLKYARLCVHSATTEDWLDIAIDDRDRAQRAQIVAEVMTSVSER